MRLFARDGLRGEIIDLDTGLRVPKVIWFDIEAGFLEAYKTNPDGSIQKDAVGDYLTYQASGRFKFVQRDVKPIAKVNLGAPRCSLCSSPLTLAGDDLCPRCRAKERGQRHPMAVESISNPLLDRKCCLCSRLAVWSVSDEVDVSHQVGNFFGRKAYFTRGATVGRRYYCASHYQPPRLLDPKGEIIKEFEDAGGVRPQ